MVESLLLLVTSSKLQVAAEETGRDVPRADHLNTVLGENYQLAVNPLKSGTSSFSSAPFGGVKNFTISKYFLNTGVKNTGSTRLDVQSTQLHQSTFLFFFPLGKKREKGGTDSYFPLLFKNLLLNPSVQQPLERADLAKLWVSL